VRITTGRTHQIRRHLASIGHPVVGDRRYGGAKAPRLMLHAWKLEHDSIGTIEAPPVF
jgi:23S rRNA-/tRNA-specific pseudouridylate synthase